MSCCNTVRCVLLQYCALCPVVIRTMYCTVYSYPFVIAWSQQYHIIFLQDSCSGRTPLHYAVEAENFIIVNFLLENSCNVNAQTFAGNTPLHVAAGRRLKEIVALLMAYGANPALANGEGDFPSDLPASLLVSFMYTRSKYTRYRVQIQIQVSIYMKWFSWLRIQQ